MTQLRIVGFAGLVSVAALLAACSVRPPDAIGPTGEQLLGYFDAKSGLARKLQNYFTGTNGDATYRLVALNGPVYPIGALVAANNPLEIESRACQLSSDKLPAGEPWANQPFFASDRKLDLNLAIPAPIRGVFQSAQTSLGAGIKIDTVSGFGIGDISQVLISRADLRDVLQRPECAAALLAAEGSKAVFVRGIVYGQETLTSSRKVDAGLGLKVMTGETGQFSIGFDSTGAYELKETSPHPKFAIVAEVTIPGGETKSWPPRTGDPEDALFSPPSSATLQRIEALRRD